jgi:hypothetical protein
MRSLGIFALLFCTVATSAEAGVFTDDLSRCLVSKSTEADKGKFMGWMFSAVSADPGLQKFTNLDRAKRNQLAKDAADVFQRLLLVDCRKEAVAALRAEGDNTIEQSFGALGRAATQQMFQSQEAQTELDALGKNFDTEKIKALAKEDGINEKDEKK